MLDEWTSADGVKLALQKAPDGTDSELSNGDDTYAHTYAAGPKARPQGDMALPGRVGQAGIEHAKIGDITVITDFPAFVAVTGYDGTVTEYLAEVAVYYRNWSEGHHYWIWEDGVVSEFVHAGLPSRSDVEAMR